ncbi:MAG: DUF4157 domain-containing protein [Bacteroidota bacterium]|nr:DUF4157 domain-containing protein [Bacteroidota bacterium]
MKRNSRHFVRKQNQQNERSRSPFFNLAHDESKQHPSFFQTQLKTGEKGDKYEKEADNAAGKVANKVHASPEPVVQKQDISAVQMSSLKENEEKTAQKMDKEEEQKPVQKAEKKEEEKPIQKEEKKEEEKPIQKEEKKEEEKPVQKEEKKEEDKPVQKAEAEENKDVQPKHEEEEKNEHPPIMRKEKEGTRANKGSDIADRIKKTKGKGQPMSEKTARQMEQAFGADFSNVNIHTDEQAASLNKDLHSIAFTNGSDIYFTEGQYNPDSSSGKTLLAHELTHVIQQTGK